MPHLDIGHLLLTRSASADARTRFGTTALHFAVICGDELSVKLLLRCQRSGFQFSARFGTTALHSAVTCGDERSVKLLLR